MDSEVTSEVRGIIEPVEIDQEMRSAYIDYSMSVIVSRALPDVRDGLKPVQRRVLFGMDGLGLSYGGQTKKSARIVGEVLGKFHPHGDSSVYDAMARLAQNWNQRYPLVFGQGNFGSMDGDPVAAMRYTEAKLEKITEEVLADLDKRGQLVGLKLAVISTVNELSHILIVGQKRTENGRSHTAHVFGKCAAPVKRKLLQIGQYIKTAVRRQAVQNSLRGGRGQILISCTLI